MNNVASWWNPDPEAATRNREKQEREEVLTMLRQRAGEKNPHGAQDQIAIVCLAHLPDKIKLAIRSYNVENAVFVNITFKNGFVVWFRKDWKSFLAECILVHDLTPSEQ